MKVKQSAILITKTVLITASGIAGLSGYYPTVTLAILAYVADTSKPQSRALKLGILEGITFICGTIVQFISGTWIQSHGYESVYLVILTAHLLNLLYIVIFLPESLPSELTTQNTPICSYDGIKPIFTVYLQKRVGRWVLLSLLVCAVLVYLTSFILQTLLVLYGKKAPLCWEESLIGYFSGTLLLSKAVGAVVGIALCSRLGISNFGATQLGTIFLIGSLVMIGFSRSTLEMFLGTILSFFSGVPQPCIRAEMSKLVNKEEQGALFAILASLESLCNFSSQLIFIPLYTWTVTKLKGEYVGGITFFINAGLLLIPVILIGIIQCHKPQSKRKEFSPLLDNENPVS
ncbi:proton-coupled folate transporter-like isoform X4 [Acropora muricata]|uniref:proton-coupled folate transporter-like isoform X4 n=1 Tax=Acropora muricata TaxID=159855 RepID=UPI0034E39380